MTRSGQLSSDVTTPVAPPSSRLTFHLWRLPCVLSFLLLAFQVILPWTAHHFVTQDGPSHLYNAVAARELLFNGHSPYAWLYAFQSKLIPNWTTTILLAVAAALVGPDHAEQLLVSAILLALYFAFAYACRSLHPRASGYTPVANFLIQTWFLAMGFYNFLLGMAGYLFLIGFYLRCRQRWTLRLSAWLAAAGVVLFFTHLLPAALLCLTLAVVEGWLLLQAPAAARRTHSRQIGLLALSLLPVLLFIAAFLHEAKPGDSFRSEAKQALKTFPRHVFILSLGRSGKQEVLAPAILAYLAISVLALRRRDWRSTSGAILLTLLLTFALYLYVPDQGMGGGEVKVRFAWAMCLLAGLLACSIRRWQAWQVPLSLYVTVLLTINLLTVMHVNARASRLVEAYLAAADIIPPISRFVRLRYPAPETLTRYRLNGAPVDPLLHADALLAARRRHLDLTDYEALSRQFPLRYRPPLSDAEQWRLWILELADQSTADWLRSLDQSTPLPIDYALAVGDAPTPDTLALLEARAHLVHTAGTPPFLRIYRWRHMPDPR